MVSSVTSSYLLFWQPKETEVSAAFAEGVPPFVSCTPSFDAQQFYSHVTGFSKVSSAKSSAVYTYENPFLTKRGILRPYSYTVEDATDTDLEASVKAKAARMFASAVSYDVTIYGHKDGNGNVFTKNGCVSLKAAGAMVYKETKLLIDAVELKRSDTEGDQTTLKLVLPGSRVASDLPNSFPWED
mgnify:FL=1